MLTWLKLERQRHVAAFSLRTFNQSELGHLFERCFGGRRVVQFGEFDLAGGNNFFLCLR